MSALRPSVCDVQVIGMLRSLWERVDGDQNQLGRGQLQGHIQSGKVNALPTTGAIGLNQFSLPIMLVFSNISSISIHPDSILL